MTLSERDITIELSAEEALVLFEFVWRFSQDGILKIQDQSEERVLWDLCANLESKLIEPFEENYPERLANARQKVGDSFK